MKKHFSFTFLVVCIAFNLKATVWRVNNTNGVDADFTSVSSAISNASVLNGDTLYIEPSSTSYGSVTLTKQLTFIGNGYYLGGANGNAGLQATENASTLSVITLNTGSNGSKFYGLSLSYFSLGSAAGLGNYVIESCQMDYIFQNQISTQTYSDIAFRKCVITQFVSLNNVNATVNNFIIENCIFNSSIGYGMVLNFSPSSTNLIFRNNTLDQPYFTNLTGFYVANNIFLRNNVQTFTSCVIKNNLFVANQTGVTTGALNTNGNNLVSQSRASLIVDAGSLDGKYQLAVSSPAISGGVDIGGTKPDCGAFGGTDPYKLSGIPAIPSIYSFSFPNGNSVPLNSTSILIDFSTRDNK